MDAKLRTCVQDYAVKTLSQHFAYAEILHQKSVDFCVNGNFNQRNKIFKLLILQNRIDRDVNFHAVKMSVRNDICDIVAVEILRFHTRVEIVKSEINGVRSACDGNVKSLFISCGCK